MTQAGPQLRLCAVGLHKRYKKRVVVNDVSLQLNPGEVVGLLGPNGSGKTTTFQMIVGLAPLDGGQVLLSGRDISGMFLHQRARCGIGFLPQGASVFRKLSVEDNLRVALQARCTDATEIQSRLEKLIEEFNLETVRNTRGMDLSGGERRRTEIARILATEPDFVLLDEPFAGIDPITVADISQLILLLHERGLGVLLTEHNVKETLRICDRCYIINEGHIIAAGSSEEITDNPQVKRVYLGEDFIL